MGLMFALQTQQVDAQTPANGLSGYAWSSNFGYIKLSGTAAGSAYGVRATDAGSNISNLSGYAWVSATDPDANPDTDSVGWLSFNSSDLSGCPSNPCQATLNRSTGQVSGWARFLRGNQIDGDGWVKLRGSTTGGAAYGVQVSGCQWSGYAYNGGNDDRGGGWISFRPTSGTVLYGVQGNGLTCVAPFTYSVSAEDPVTVTRPASGTLIRPVDITLTKTNGAAELVSVYDVTISGTSGATADYSAASCQPNTSCTTSIDIRVPSTANTTNSPYTVTVRTRSATGVLGSDTFTLNIQAPTAFDFDVSSNQSVLRYTAPGTQNATITVTRTAGTPANVGLSSVITAGGPTGTVVPATGYITTRFNPTACIPSAPAYSCPSTMEVSVTSAVTNGPYNVRVWGTSGSVRDFVDVQLCVNFCSTFSYRVDAPTNRIIVNRSSTSAVTRIVPIDITKLSSGTGEAVSITRITGLPAGVSTTTTSLLPCTPTSVPCRISVPVRVTAGTTSIAPFTATVYTRSANGVPGSDTFSMEAVYVSPTVTFTVDPADVTISRYGYMTPTNVVITWTGTAPREAITISDVEFDDAVANTGTLPSLGATCSTTAAMPCTRQLGLTVMPNVRDGVYDGAVQGRSTSGAVFWGTFTMRVAVGVPVVDIQGRKTVVPPTLPDPWDDGPVIVDMNGTADLQWGSYDAENCQLSSGGVNLGTPGPSGTFTTGPITTRTTFTISCTNANTITTGPVRDSIDVDVGAPTATPVANLQVSRACSASSASCDWKDAAISVPYGSRIDLRYNATNATGCTLYRQWSWTVWRSGVASPPNYLYQRGIGPMDQTRVYELVCTNGSGGEGRDTVTVNVSSSIDLTGPGGCTNCTAEQNEEVTIEWNYDGPTTNACDLTRNDGTVILNDFDPDSVTDVDVDLPTSGTSASYTISCPGGITDTVNFTLNVVQCFGDLLNNNAAKPTAAFILQDTNSQNTFTLNWKINLEGFDPDNLRLRFSDEVCTDMNVTGACANNRTIDLNIANQTQQVNSDGTFRVTMTLDNTQNQPVGEFMMELIAEDAVGSCGDERLWIPAYLIDERESLGEQ